MDSRWLRARTRADTVACVAWLAVERSDRIAPGGRMTVEADGSDVVVWRSASGVLAACDARCPHQWAHLGAAGAVDGEELVCLSHGWRFGTDGAGCKESASGRRDEKAPVEVVPVRERDGVIEIELDRGVLRTEVHAP